MFETCGIGAIDMTTVLRASVGKMCSPHPRWSNALFLTYLSELITLGVHSEIQWTLSDTVDLVTLTCENALFLT